MEVPTFPIRILGGDEPVRAYLEALSPEGMFVRTRSVRPLDTTVRVELSPPEGGVPLALDGRVARVELDPSAGKAPVGMELHFVELPREVVARLAELLLGCEDLGPEGDAVIVQLSDLDTLTSRRDRAAAQVERGEREIVTLETELEFARQADRASRTLVDQLEASRHAEAQIEHAKLEEGRGLTERRGELERSLKGKRRLEELTSATETERARADDAERKLAEGRNQRAAELESLDRRLEEQRAEHQQRRLAVDFTATETRGQLDVDLGRIEELTRELEAVRGELRQAKEAAVERLQDAREELEADVQARKQAAAARTDLEQRLALAEARGRAKHRVTPPPPPPDAFEPDPSEADGIVSGTILPAPEGDGTAEPAPNPALRAPPVRAGPTGRPSWLRLVAGTVLGSGVAVVAVIVVLVLLQWRENESEGAVVEPAEPEVVVADTSNDASDESADATAPVDAITEAPPVVEDSVEPTPDDALLSAVNDALDEEGEPDIETTPATPAELLAMAVELHEKTRWKPALKAYKAALPGNPRSYELQAGMGHVLLELGRAKQAIAHLERAVRIRPAVASAHLYLGSAYFEEGKNAEARAAFERFLELAPRDKQAKDIRALLNNLE